MGNTSFAAGDPYLTNGSNGVYYITTTTAGSIWYTYSIPAPDVPGLEVDGSVKLGGKNTNKIDWDLSRFTLIRRLKFIYNLIFKGRAIMEVNPKLIKLEKALDVLKNAK